MVSRYPTGFDFIYSSIIGAAALTPIGYGYKTSRIKSVLWWVSCVVFSPRTFGGLVRRTVGGPRGKTAITRNKVLAFLADLIVSDPLKTQRAAVKKYGESSRIVSFVCAIIHRDSFDQFSNNYHN